MSTNTPTIESVVFETSPDRGYTIKASYLVNPHERDALVQVSLNGVLVRQFLFPAYKVWNIAAHSTDIVDGELSGSMDGYESAAWNGISGLVVLPHQS